ncbi:MULTISPECIES: hypothetical protein [Pseudomonas]|uniref:Uncharacterized protein n=1 Tax=Pseudomonas reactans TaxID=117680 RepID=A0A7Y8KG38_9PSED|nr:hypothetical protein [Pseudomonas reactans]NWE87942.1 hypothetical protein [Pseudomonas reactans]
MFLNKVKLGREKALKRLPVSGVLLSVLLTKAEEQVSRVRLVSTLSEVPVSDATPFWKCFVDYGFKSIPPFVRVVNFVHREAHMSGLLGLFEWNQKASTEAPDTNNA